jgi:hypothetical protein
MKLLVALAALAALGGAARAATAATRDVTPSVSANWAGYAISDPGTIAGTAPTAPLTFTDVTGTWVQPVATCGSGGAAYSAFWVGVGGFATSSSALEQVGTESDCVDGHTPAYFAWFEIVPSPSVRINIKIHPGDTITAAVLVKGSSVLVQVKDRTRDVTFTKRLTVANPDVSSAEWIAEAPSECETRCHVLPLADFGTVAFTKIAATANGHPGTLTDPAWAALPIQLIPHSPSLQSFFGAPDDSSTAGATPGLASTDGRTFSVSWISNAVVTPTP